MPLSSPPLGCDRSASKRPCNFPGTWRYAVPMRMGKNCTNPGEAPPEFHWARVQERKVGSGGGRATSYRGARTPAPVHAVLLTSLPSPSPAAPSRLAQPVCDKA